MKDVTLKVNTCSEVHFKCDVYSYGILLWELVHRSIPWFGLSNKDLALAVISGKRPMIDVNEDDEADPEQREFLKKLIDLMKECWDPSPEKRPLFSVIMK